MSGPSSYALDDGVPPLIALVADACDVVDHVVLWPVGANGLGQDVRVGLRAVARYEQRVADRDVVDRGALHAGAVGVTQDEPLHEARTDDRVLHGDAGLVAAAIHLEAIRMAAVVEGLVRPGGVGARVVEP